jgi:hypothetical protein
MDKKMPARQRQHEKQDRMQQREGKQQQECQQQGRGRWFTKEN